MISNDQVTVIPTKVGARCNNLIVKGDSGFHQKHEAGNDDKVNPNKTDSVVALSVICLGKVETVRTSPRQ